VAADFSGGRRLLVGWNIMADFFAAVGRYVGKVEGDWGPSDLNRARTFCALGKGRFAEVFQQNGAFMNGADKAMLVAEGRWSWRCLRTPVRRTRRWRMGWLSRHAMQSPVMGSTRFPINA
jgi:hypothetical protein